MYIHSTALDLSISEEQRIQQIFQLMVDGSDDAVDTLIEVLFNDPSPIVRHEAAYVLGELSTDKSIEALINSIKHDINHFVVHEAALAVSNTGAIVSKDVLEELLESDDTDIVATANISLQRLKMKQFNRSIEDLDQEPADIILDLNSLEEHRIQSAFILMDNASESDIDLLIEALHKEIDPIVKHEIIFALGEVASSKVLRPLIQHMLDDENVYVKHEAALALATIGNKKAESSIKKLLSHPNPDVVETAEIALDRLNS